MSCLPTPALLAWARRPGPAKILAAARRRLEAGHGMARGSLRVQLDAVERDDVGDLLGVSWAAGGSGVGAKALVDALSAVGADLTDLLTSLGGPLRHLPTERAEVLARATAERAQSLEHLLHAGVASSAASAWLARSGLPPAGSGRLAELCRHVAKVWEQMPGQGEAVLLQVLAQEALGDPHSLDRGTTVANAVLRLLAGGAADLATDAESWRDSWENHGVVCDPVSSRVLVYNLRLIGTAPACRLTSAAGAEPIWLTWRSLVGGFSCEGGDVHVCENPSVVIAAADRLGPESRPLVCTGGRPSSAVRRLLTGLATAPVSLHVRADDDVVGQEIITGLLDLLPGARLWRYTRRSAVDARASPHYEEEYLELLLADLSTPS